MNIENSQSLEVKESKPTPKVFYFLLTLFGIALLIIGISLLSNYLVNKDFYEKTTAKITKIELLNSGGYKVSHKSDDSRHYVYLHYTANGKEYSDVYYGYYDATMYEGKIIEIQYDRRDPGKPIVPSNTTIIISIVLLSIGTILCTTDIILIINKIKKRRQAI